MVESSPPGARVILSGPGDGPGPTELVLSDEFGTPTGRIDVRRATRACQAQGAPWPQRRWHGQRARCSGSNFNDQVQRAVCTSLMASLRAYSPSSPAGCCLNQRGIGLAHGAAGPARSFENNLLAGVTRTQTSSLSRCVAD